MDTIAVADFYKALNDLLGLVSEFTDVSNTIGNITLGHLEESTTGLEMDEPIKQYALSYYKHQQMDKIQAIFGVCKELSMYDNVMDDEKRHYLDWAVNLR